MAGGRERGRVVEHFAGLVDPRAERAKRHELLDSIVITICGVICGADNWVEIEEFGNARLEWLSRFLRLPHGIPSHDTFGRVFGRLDPDQFGACFMNWVQSVAELTQGEVVAIDGKTLRRCHDRGQGRAPLHLVSAWAAQNHLVLGQTRTQAHSNEITAIPQLLALLELRGCIITIDAMGCQTEIAQQIVDGAADYLVAVKSNQRELYENIQDLFQMAAQEGALSSGRKSCQGIRLSSTGLSSPGGQRPRTPGDPGVLGDHRPSRTGLRGSPPALAGTKRRGQGVLPTGRPPASTPASTPGPTLGGPLLHLQLPAQRGIPTPGQPSALGHREQPPLGAGHGL